MFFKQNARPAFAAAASSGTASFERKTRDGMMYSASGEASDFNAFGSPAEETSRPRRTKRRPAAPKKAEWNWKSILIVAASLVALLLLVVLILNIFTSRSADLKKEDHTYVSFLSDNTYSVAMDGEVMGTTFENEIHMTVAADNSFAYVVEDSPEGMNVYLLKDKKIELFIPTPVIEVIALAEFEPGVVYSEEKGIYFITSDNEDRLTKDPAAGNFIISSDASAVAYTEPDDKDPSQSILYLFRDGVEEKYAKNMIPVSVSAKGNYLFAYGVSSEDGISKMLYMIDSNNIENKIKVQESGFDRITYSNVKGTEIIYSTISAEGAYKSFIFNVKEQEPHAIGGGVLVPLVADPSIARLASLKNILVENVAKLESSATYRLNKMYEPELIAKYNGTLNAKGDQFYFVNSEGTLSMIDLGSKELTKKKIYNDVLDFAITEKNNVYLIDADNRLMFYKSSTGKKNRISDDVIAISMHKYENVLYFEIEDDIKSYYTEEGSGKKVTEFARAEVASAPRFIDPAQKKTFAYTYNESNGSYILFYTANGSSFKQVAEDCSDINGMDFDLGEAIEDIVNKVTD